MKILPLLSEASPNFPSFHVVAFSLPGYGFSEAPRKNGFHISQYEEVCVVKAMDVPSYIDTSTDRTQADAVFRIRRIWSDFNVVIDSFHNSNSILVTQGGDVGFFVSSRLLS